jgi:hypothetical protein
MSALCALVAALLLAAPAPSLGAAASGQLTCREGDKTNYVLWNFETRTATLLKPEVVEKQLRELVREASKGLKQAVGLVSATCRDERYLLQMEQKNKERVQDLSDKSVLFGIGASGADLQFHIVPYILANGSGAAPKNHGSCTEGKSDQTVIENEKRVLAFGFAALALYEMRLLESKREPCRMQRAEVFVKQAIAYLAKLRTPEQPIDSESNDLLIHLKDKCLGLEKMIDEISKTSDRCEMPGPSSKLTQGNASACQEE